METAAKHIAGWQNPYVTDGLIAMWDGIWNASPGVYNNEASCWVDIVGGVVCRMNRGMLTWGKDEAQLDKCVLHSDSAPAIEKAYRSGEYTIEICVKSNDDRVNFCGIFGSSSSLLSPWSNNAMYLVDWTKPLNDGKWGSGFTSKEFRAKTLVAKPNGPQVEYFNGSLESKFETANNVIGDSDRGFQLLGLDATFTFPATCNAKFIRIYDRALTPEEVAKNYATDKERFVL